MKRLTIKSLVAVMAIALTTVAAAAVACVVWTAATTEGTRWLLATVVPLGGVSFSAQKIEGRALDHLLLTGVRVGSGQQALELETIELRWKPLLLLTGTVAVKELAINGVKIQDDALSEVKPPILAWPSVSGNEQLFDVTIGRVRMTDIIYRRLQEQPLRVASITGSATWQDGILSITGLETVSPAGSIHGTVSAGFKRPFLEADLAIATAHPLAGMDRFTLQVRPATVISSEQVAGEVTVAGGAGMRKLLELGGEVGMTSTTFNLRQIFLTSPGRRGMVTADGSLAVTPREPVLTLEIKASGLDLAHELNLPTDLSGVLRFAGTPDSYRGTVTLANQAHDWQSATLSASYHGTREGATVAPLNARILDGTVAGSIDLDWRDSFVLRGSISGRNLDPARVDPGWKGVANFNATGSLAWAGNRPITGYVSGILLESRLHGQALTGRVEADFAGNNLSLSRLELQGKGFNLLASGELNDRLALTAQISDLSRLIPGSTGAFDVEGWVRWRDRQLSGAASGTGSALAYGGARAATADLTARFLHGTASPLHVSASLRDVAYSGYTMNAVTFAAAGTPLHHTVNASLRSAGAGAEMTMSAGYSSGLWEGNITRFSGGNGSGPWNLEAPAAFAVGAGKFSLSPLALTSAAGERVEAAADLVLSPLIGQFRLKWAGLNLARANPYLKDEKITGNSHGTLRTEFLPGSRLTMEGNAAGSGIYTRQGASIMFEQSSLTLSGNENGIKVGIDVHEATGGRLHGTFSSSAPFRLSMPDKGKLTVELSGINLALLKPWFPADTRVAGRLSGRANGNMIPGQRFELDGSAALSGGTIHQKGGEGGVNLTSSSATANWEWRGESLSGTLVLTMATYGQARGSFQLPVPARFPLAVNQKGPLQAKLAGQFQERGIISDLFPGMVQKSFGELDAELSGGGTWEDPHFDGTLKLSGAGAYLPSAGIQLKDVQLAARLEKNLILIDSFRAFSGPGHIEGTALITLAGWRVSGYHGTIRGDNFQTVHFPEFQLLCTPELTFDGTPQKFRLRGDLRLPELSLYGSPASTVITPSSDIIMEGAVVPIAARSPLALDVQIRVLLGDKVFIKVAGIDARLGGAVDLSSDSLDSITSSGEINVVKGRYRTYGVDLEIVRGRLYFAGGPVNRPALDFLALRTVGDVRAGVTVTGPLQNPVTKLYSVPAMPDVDVLAYIVLGHPLGTNGEQTGLMAQAAGALLTSSQASVLQDQLKNQLGLSTLEIQGGVGGSTSPMGYKPLPATAPGSIPAAVQPGITETMLTVGKFLTPKLYISYGRSLFTGSNLFLLRYDIFKQWQIETQTGNESGADLFYKLEFK
ncbi:MAG: translocation/assembly module TamB domain-containing protein [Desulfuromonadaceae bacterium]|nr:translocation/assembly module TamB domain-containing protein [Desulfuromonadaceae bacterium]MDD5106998.1 translocation/assembly module TamB domain-containing protein [Desulfuromonadaceae bacterium]